MSDQDIIDTILRQLGWGRRSYREDAEAIFAALQRRYAIVELPKKVGVNGADNTVWLDNPYVEQDFSGCVVISDRVGVDAEELLPLAAALLAAAAAAEADQ